MQKQPFPVGGGSRKFEDLRGGIKNFRTREVTGWGEEGLLLLGGVNTPLHAL